MDGVLVVDKPEGLTSHDVVAAARRALGERRIGHTGTLDPIATGVLVLACGRATRLVRFLAAADKDYDASIRFGLSTDTWDIAGREVRRSTLVPERAAVERELEGLTGDYLQVPPGYSAKKVAGTRAYALARRDQPVELAAVPVHVARAALQAFDGPSAAVSLTCSAGFYVRSFAQMLGQRLGSGACLAALRRTRSGEFTLADAVSFEELVGSPAAAANRVIAIDRLLGRFPAVDLSAEERRRVSHGQEVLRPRIRAGVGQDRSEPAWVRMLDPEGHLVAVATFGSRPDSLHPAVVLI